MTPFKMGEFDVSLHTWKTNKYAHQCEVCETPFKIRHRRKYPTLCKSCAVSYAMTNRNRKNKGLEPLNIYSFKCGYIAKNIYEFLARH